MPDVYEFYNLGIGEPFLFPLPESWVLAICWMKW